MAWARKLDGDAGPRLRAARRRRGGRGLGVGGGAVRVLLQASTTCARSSTSTASARAAPRCTSTTSRSTRRGCAPSAGRRRWWTATTWRALREAFARARASAGQALRARGPHAQGQGRLLPRGQGGLARQAGEEGRGAGAGRSPSSATPTSRSRSSRGATTASPTRAARAAAGAHARLHAGPGGGHARGLRHRAGQARAAAAPQVVAHRRRHQELDLLRALQGGGARALRRRRTSPSRTWSGAALGMSTEGKIPFASTFACFLTPRLRLHPHGRLLAAAAPGAVRQPRRASRSARTGRRRWRSRTWP